MNSISRLGWYWRRFRSMSGKEVFYRIEEQWKRNSSKYFPKHFRENESIGFPQPLPGIENGLKRLAGDKNLIANFHKVFIAAKKNKLTFLGQTWPGEELENKWHFDPVSGQYWGQDQYCFATDIRQTAELGDIKYVWELNRLSHLQAIAVYAKITNSKTAETFCIEEIISWIDANPPFKGVNWRSGIELALRVVSLLTVTSILGDEAFSKVQRKKISECLKAHGYWLYRFPSKYSSANNHLVAEAGGLYLLGTLFPNLENARKYESYGRKVLSEEIDKQIFSDGVGAEQSPTYQAFSMEWFLLCGVIAERLGQRCSQKYWKRLEKGAVFLRWIMDHNACMPRIGDDDEGHVLFTTSDPKFYVAEILAQVVAILKKPDIAPPLNDISNVGQLLYGPIPFREIGPTGTKVFTEGGYSVNRWVCDEKEAVFVFDHGPLGYLSIAAHGHADTHSIWFHLDGNPIFVDAGTFHYHAGGDTRDLFRGTEMHNTFSIEGENSSQIAGPFNWSSKALTSNLNYDINTETPWVESTHNGYEKRWGIKCSRRVSWKNSHEITIDDKLEGVSVPTEVKIHFLLHPELDAVIEGDCVILKGRTGALLRAKFDNILTCQLRTVGEGDAEGGYSPSFAEKKPCVQIVLSGKMIGDKTLATELEILK